MDDDSSDESVDRWEDALELGKLTDLQVGGAEALEVGFQAFDSTAAATAF
jgi:hypothetical protein